MKGTEHFKRTIQMYLEQRAAEDTLFAKNYRNPAGKATQLCPFWPRRIIPFG